MSYEQTRMIDSAVHRSARGMFVDIPMLVQTAQNIIQRHLVTLSSFAQTPFVVFCESLLAEPQFSIKISIALECLSLHV